MDILLHVIVHIWAENNYPDSCTLYVSADNFWESLYPMIQPSLDVMFISWCEQVMSICNTNHLISSLAGRQEFLRFQYETAQNIMNI